MKKIAHKCDHIKGDLTSSGSLFSPSFLLRFRICINFCSSLKLLFDRCCIMIRGFLADLVITLPREILLSPFLVSLDTLLCVVVVQPVKLSTDT